MKTEARAISWIGAAAALLTAIVALLAYMLPRSAGTGHAATATVPSVAPRGTDSASGAGGPTPANDRFASEYTDLVFTMPEPSQPPCAIDDATTVTFMPDGPLVGTDSSLNVGYAINGDLSWSGCGRLHTWALVVSNATHMAKMDGRPDPQTCASDAMSRPVAKTLLAQEVTVGSAYCLVDGYARSQVVYFVVTSKSGHSLGFTATGWLDRT